MAWTDIRGHEAVWETLSRRIAGERLPHALLFAGPPGIGKALLVRRLAARLACTGSGERPCGDCPQCQQVAAGSHPDLIAVSPPAGKGPAAGDAAAEPGRKRDIGIDQARALKRFVQLEAVSAARKMAIVDDADRLTVAAQNALLKTLEEPPGRALIALVTARPDVLLSTVRSRCQRVICRPLDEEQVRAVLAMLGLADDESAALAAVAEGSPGRALWRREMWSGANRTEIEHALAEVEGAGYGTIFRMSRRLGGGETDTAANLEGLMAFYRERVLKAAAAGDQRELDRALRRAAVVAGALRTLRWRTPNRGLLADAVALRLARN